MDSDHGPYFTEYSLTKKNYEVNLTEKEIIRPLQSVYCKCLYGYYCFNSMQIKCIRILSEVANLFRKSVTFR
ncbi:hypothetical protein TNCT_408031 [Trichonephila clavata]|uniref:Uncharacterized protein n=1 Tax=Trichonephila clavata TaxID=2740835 RepID=A0A8X6IAY6_TRICU|nr:hypothetical protein TNCT_408031 [Trichonephila clavata]